jgi:hypothetical protein
LLARRLGHAPGERAHAVPHVENHAARAGVEQRVNRCAVLVKAMEL